VTNTNYFFFNITSFTHNYIKNKVRIVDNFFLQRVDTMPKCYKTPTTETTNTKLPKPFHGVGKRLGGATRDFGHFLNKYEGIFVTFSILFNVG